MPTYLYRTEDGAYATSITCPISKMRRKIRMPNGYWAYRDIAAEHRDARSGDGGWPIKSDAMGVHPSQRKSMTAFCDKMGVPTEFGADGRPILRDRAHRAAHMKIRGCFDMDGGYGDAQQGDSMSMRELGPEHVEYI